MLLLHKRILSCFVYFLRSIFLASNLTLCSVQIIYLVRYIRDVKHILYAKISKTNYSFKRDSQFPIMTFHVFLFLSLERRHNSFIPIIERIFAESGISHFWHCKLLVIFELKTFFCCTKTPVFDFK